MSTAVAVPVVKAPSRSPTAIIVRKLFRRKLVLAGAAILVVVALLAFFAPWVTPYDPMAMKISDRLQSPRAAHWFGTDAMMSFPDILLAIALVAVLGTSMTNVILALAIVYTPRVARVVRASTLVVRE